MFLYFGIFRRLFSIVTSAGWVFDLQNNAVFRSSRKARGYSEVADLLASSRAMVLGMQLRKKAKGKLILG